MCSLKDIVCILDRVSYNLFRSFLHFTLDLSHMELADVTCLSGDGLGEAIEHTELIFIIGM